jgi:micrococcal nuclease
VNTPETKHPRKGVEPYGKEASAFTTARLTGKMVYLEKDISEKDRYGRLLRYIWLAIPQKMDSDFEIRQKMFNAILLLRGYAQVATFPPDVKYQHNYQLEAQKQNLGLWGLK